MPNIRFALSLALLLFASAASGGDRFTLSSPTVKPDAMLGPDQIFNGFGCAGNNLSPALKWTPGPESTKSYAITVYDPDAPTGSGWWHWVVYNIPANATELPAGAGQAGGKLLPAGAAQGRNDFGSAAFGGACPPKGDKPHHYVFTIYALKSEKIEVPADASAALVGFTIHANQIGSAAFTARYGR